MFTPHHVSHVRCHMSRVTCHVSGITCQVLSVNIYLSIYIYLYIYLFFFFFFQSDGASRWRVCYERDLPCLVFTYFSPVQLNFSFTKVTWGHGMAFGVRFTEYRRTTRKTRDTVTMCRYMKALWTRRHQFAALVKEHFSWHHMFI